MSSLFDLPWTASSWRLAGRFSAFYCVIARERHAWICELYLWRAVKLTSRSTCDRASTSLFLTEWSWSPDAGTTSKSDSKELSASGWSNAYISPFLHNTTIYPHTPFKSQSNTSKIYRPIMIKYYLVSTTDCKFIFMIIQWPKHRLYCKRSISKCLSIQSANTTTSLLEEMNTSSHDWVKTGKGRKTELTNQDNPHISPFKNTVYLVLTPNFLVEPIWTAFSE